MVVVHGSIAPLIELGAGFDMDLTARENIYLNGTVLGLTPKVHRRKNSTRSWISASCGNFWTFR